MIKMFEELGNLTTAYWTKLGGHDEAFPEAATSALADTNVLKLVEVGEIIDWLAASCNVPEQYSRDFGQPPVNVYVADKFFIQVLFWLDATTAIHEHAFAGAFGVLSGSSVHSQYTFELREALSKELRLGKVHFVSSEILHRGDLRAIHAGDAFIHALFHLDRPSVSVVVRTRGLATQYSYVKPHVAYDPFYEDTTLNIRLKLLDSLGALRSEQFWKYAELLIDQANPLMLFHVLARTYQSYKDHPSSWEQLLDKATSLFGSNTVECLAASIKESERDKKLFRLRSVVHNPHYRFLLALLLNVPRRDTLLELVSKEFGSQQPESLVMQWITEMSDAGLFLTKFEPDLLDTMELALQHGSFERARAAVVNSGSADSPLLDEQKMKKLWHTAESMPFFQPLFINAV